MTSSAPLVDFLLERLNALPPGVLSSPTCTELHDLHVARAATPADRLADLNDLLLATDCLEQRDDIDIPPTQGHRMRF